MPRQTNIQIRRGTASDWTSVNPTLAQGEIAMETDTKKIKVGDGSTAWNALRYVGADGGDLDAAGGGSPTTTTSTSTTTTTSAPSGDQYFSNVSLLMHMDGSNGSTSFIDSSSFQHAETVTDAQISTAQSKFGGASGYFNGASWVAYSQQSQGFTFGSSNFTIEFWMKDSGSSGGYPLVISNNQVTDQGIWFGRYANGSTHLQVGANSNEIIVNEDIPVNVFDGSWHHVAIVRNNDYLSVFIDGTSQLSVLISSETVGNQSGDFYVGGAPNYGSYFTGYLDELRITKGIARYAGSFNPQTSAFPNNI